MKDTLDGRKLWLDEAITYAGEALSKLLKTEPRRPLSDAELKLKHMSAAYCYLYDKAKDCGILDEEDDYYIFEKETIH